MFQSPYQEFIFTRTYARWIEEEKRRETWPEAVERYRNFFAPRVPEELLPEFDEAINKILHLEVMPSMRALQTAGPALERDNVAGYNCSYLVIDNVKAFADMLYILMCGTGVGFSTEERYISQLPTVPKISVEAEKPIIVMDSKIGWAEGLLELMNQLYAGILPRWDLSLIRPKGARLKTFGGRASGPEPLHNLFQFVVDTFLNAQGRKLKSIEIYDICMMIAQCVVSGGVRRSATINLSDRWDEDMANAKVGEFWLDNPQRSMSNNSAVYETKPTFEEFWKDWTALAQSGTGERGIVNRQGLQEHVEWINTGRDPNHLFGVNPCGEIILRPKQFCNLTEVVVRHDDDVQSLKEKVKAATILGILQATLTDFRFLDDVWKKNTEEERLLGVSLTGLKDHPILRERGGLAGWILGVLRQVAWLTAGRWAEALGINPPAAITCVKPSGTVSQLVDSSSGLHSRYGRYYVRRVRVAANDPLAQYLRDAGVPWYPEVGQTVENMTTTVFEFPVAAPETSIIKGEETAIEQLEYWRMLKMFWTDHNPSCTIYVKEHEWDEVGRWVYENWEFIGGLSFLPDDGGVYELAPYEVIDKETYDKIVASMPKLDFSKLSEYEQEDKTTGSREFACTGDKCEL